MINKSEELMNNLVNDNDYQEYISVYKDRYYVNKDILNTLLQRHIELYYLFLKINILIYRYDTKSLSKDLKDYTHFKGTTLFIDDIVIIMNYYFNNYLRCKNEINKIITYKLRPLCERKILKQIINRQPHEEIKPFPKYIEF